MKVRIEGTSKLVDGELVIENVKEFETDKTISLTLLHKWDEKKGRIPVIYIQVGNFLEKDFKEYDLTEEGSIRLSNK